MTDRLTDPRPSVSDETNVFPVVARQHAGTPAWLVASVAVVGAVLLFAVLENQREARVVPTARVRTVDGVPMPSAPPPLLLPFSTEMPEVPPPPPPPLPPLQAMATPAYAPAPQPAFSPPTYVMPSTPPPPGSLPVYTPAQTSIGSPTTGSRGDTLVIDTTRPASRSAPALGEQRTGVDAVEGSPVGLTEPASADAIRAQQLGRRSTIVPQGTLIPAVLETALDSTRPGYVRAMVTRDVMGFDGARVLIPRGSRLVGEYNADLGPGQKRAVVQWTRLVRPDGVAIAIESPAADRVGRSGIGGRVDTHFLERFGAAILQSTVYFGMGLASRSLDGDRSLIVALPGSTQSGGAASLAPSQIQPTLRVDAGVTVTVFVSRDLEFPATATQR